MLKFPPMLEVEFDSPTRYEGPDRKIGAFALCARHGYLL